MSIALVAILVALATLVAIAYGPSAVEVVRRSRAARRRALNRAAYDPGRERRAEARARELLRSVVGAEVFAMYRELGFLKVGGRGDYAYLIYPHRPIVAYDTATGELLNEYCVAFPDGSEPGLGDRLPDSDDVLAKWMALHGGERRLIEDSNMHMPGRQIDPAQVSRDLRRLREWEGRRSSRAVA